MPTGNPNANLCPYQSKSLLSGKRKKEILKEERKRKEERRARELREEADEQERRYLQNSIAAAAVSGKSAPVLEHGLNSLEYLQNEKCDETNSDLRLIENSIINSKACGKISCSFKGKQKAAVDLRSRFQPESADELKHRMGLAQAVIKAPSVSHVGSYLKNEFVNVNLTDVGYFLPIPRRPCWSKDMNKEQLDASEEQYFSAYIQDTQSKADDQMNLNKFELNLEVWRQLWRVGERSDILLVLADVRCPLFSFPQSLYDYVVETVKKPIIIVLTKVDLVPQQLVSLWINWFRIHYPTAHVVPFSSHPKPSSEDESKPVESQNAPLKREKARKLKGTRLRIPFGITELHRTIQEVVVKELHFDEIDFTPTHLMSTRELEEHQLYKKVSCEPNEGLNSRKCFDDIDHSSSSASTLDRINSPHQSFNSVGDDIDSDNVGMLSRELRMIREKATTVGVIGLPNAGKSSFINALAGRRVVSVSKTPGHTKHLQTIFLNRTLQLCDCPGLVFPVIGAAYPMQVLFGLINIAQVREVFSSLAFVAERIPLVEIYDLRPPDNNKVTEKFGEAPAWSGLEIAEAWAEKRSYYTSKSRLDAHRAGNEILRDIVSGRVVFALAPPKLGTKEFL